MTERCINRGESKYKIREYVREKGGQGMRAAIILGVLALLVVPPAVWGDETADEVLARVLTVRGDVQIGQGAEWRTAVTGDTVSSGQFIRTGTDSGMDIFFEEDLVAAVGEETEIEIADLLLKTRLEKMRSRISAPDDTRRVDIQVTPTTGVRGTEQTENKAEDLKREHYWNESVK